VVRTDDAGAPPAEIAIVPPSSPGAAPGTMVPGETPPGEPPAVVAPPEAPAPGEGMPGEPPAEGAPPGEAAPPAQPEKTPEQLAEEVRLRRALEADKIRFVVQQKLDAARVHIRNVEYPEAEKLLLEAQELDPTNREVRAELRDVQAGLGRRAADAGGMLEEMRERVRVRIDEQRTTAAKHVGLGRMHMAAGRWNEAIENYEQALFIMNASPYQIDWRNLKSEAENGLRDARRSREEAERSQRENNVNEALAAQAREQEAMLLQQQARLERLMGAAIEAFNRNQFLAAEEYATRILNEQPDNTKARDLQLAAQRARHDQIEGEHLKREKIAFREWMDDMNATRILQDRILKWPSKTFWDQISVARAKSRPTFGESADDPEAAALLKKVAGLTVNLEVENQTFKEVVKTLQVQTQLNIIIDPRAATDVQDQPVTGLHLQGVALDTVLTLLQKSGGDDVIWTTRGNIVMFTKKDLVPKNLVVQIHSVADLTTGLTDFIPPTIQLVGPDSVSDEEHPLFGAEGEEPVLPYGTIDELIELIKSAVQPTYWSETAGADIKPSASLAIAVKASPQIQERVDQFLTDLRGFAGLVVTVETRFLQVGDHFLRDVGVDFRGLNPATGGTLVNLDDVTNGLEDSSSAGFDNLGGGLTTGAALNPSAGAFFNDGGDGDFRGRTENIFNRSLGSVLSSLGGATLSLSYLDDSQFSLIVRAVEKNGQIRTLTAPTITVYNTQRANLTVVNQLSYIQDFDVEVAQTSFIADPIVGIIQDGLTLDVRPTVSNDRRYITLELQPTVADLIEPIPTFATTLASSFAPVIIQLPELKLQQARVTVRIPDRGSILIGGLKSIITVDRQSETPFLGKIPLLSFLFSRKGRADEMTNLMILVKATITDLAEQQDRLMSR
jgi:type II secretory pathway component GspD/PulD (secretin)